MRTSQSSVRAPRARPRSGTSDIDRPSHCSASRPRYTPGARRAFSRSSSRHARFRAARLEKSRYGKRTAFFSFQTWSPTRNTHAMCVSTALTGPRTGAIAR